MCVCVCVLEPCAEIVQLFSNRPSRPLKGHRSALCMIASIDLPFNTAISCPGCQWQQQQQQRLSLMDERKRKRVMLSWQIHPLREQFHNDEQIKVSTLHTTKISSIKRVAFFIPGRKSCSIFPRHENLP